MKNKDTHISTDTNKTTTNYIYYGVMNTFVNKTKKFFLSTFVKLTSLIIPFIGRGNGYTWPGYFLLKFYPDALRGTKYKKGIILISGTNGKTTTSKVITHLLCSVGYSVVSNSSGANLLSGIVTAVFSHTDFWGNNLSDYGVFEVDEFALPQVLQYLSPSCIALLNLSRDQLDRYGEVDTITCRWHEALSKIKSPCFLVLNKEQPEFENFKEVLKSAPVYFDSSPEYLKDTSLRGSFNALNINAAINALVGMGISKEDLLPHLARVETAYGRGEVVTYKDKNYRILLAKNPASFNHNLELAMESKKDYDSVIFVLNDNIPDGRDVSWIYDINPSKLLDVCEGKKLYVSGTRAHDMAVRLAYAGAGISSDSIKTNLKELLENGEKNTLVLPNYSAMLEVRKVLVGRDIL